MTRAKRSVINGKGRAVGNLSFIFLNVTIWGRRKWDFSMAFREETNLVSAENVSEIKMTRFAVTGKCGNDAPSVC